MSNPLTVLDPVDVLACCPPLSAQPLTQDHAHDGGLGERDTGVTGDLAVLGQEAGDLGGGQGRHGLGVGTQAGSGRGRLRAAQRGQGGHEQGAGGRAGRDGPA